MNKQHVTMTPMGFVGHSFLAVIPVMMAMLILPIYVKLRTVTIDAMTDDFYSSKQFDMHAVAREEMLIALTSIAVVFFLISTYLLYGKIVICMKQIVVYAAGASVYVGFTWLSAICSDNQEVSFRGLFCNGQGFYSELCYIILFLLAAYATFFLMNTEVKKGKSFIRGENLVLPFLAIPLMIVLIVNVFIGTLQFMGVDVFSIDFIARYVAGKDYELYNFHSAFAPGRVFGTFYNPNYAGVYGVLMFGVFIGFALAVKKLVSKICFAVCAILVLIFTLSIVSEGAFLGVLAVLVAYAIIYYRMIKKYWYVFVGAMVAVGLILGIFFTPTVVALSQSVVGMIHTLVEPYNREDALLIQDITFVEGHIVFSTKDGDFQAFIEEGASDLCVALEGEVLYKMSIKEPKAFCLPNTVLSEITFQVEPISDTECHLMLLPNWKFYMNSSGECHAISAYNGTQIEIDKPDLALSNINPMLGSNRIYIWSRTIPLLKDYLLLGCGPDNFVFQFPQYDLLGREECEIPATIIFLNAHNSYLQVAMNNGGIAFLAFLTILGHYVLSSMRIYIRKEKKDMLDYIGIGIFTAIAGGMVSLIFVDMFIYFASMFWTMLGVGIAVNARNKKNA